MRPIQNGGFALGEKLEASTPVWSRADSAELNPENAMTLPIKTLGDHAKWSTSLFATCLVLAFSCGGETHANDRKVGGETSFLASCSPPGNCSEGTCICGVCTVYCDDSSTCDDQNATCSGPGSADFAVRCGEGDDVQRPICLPTESSVPIVLDAGTSSSQGWANAIQETPRGGSFTRIWGTSDHVWLIGSVLPGEVEDGDQPESGPVRRCGSVPVQNVILRRVGEQWSELEPPTMSELVAVHGSSDADVWVVGSDGVVFQYDGEGWHEHDTGIEPSDDPRCPDFRLSSVFALSPDDVWSVGHISPSDEGSGVILHYDGATWSQVLPNPAEPLFDVLAFNSTDAWAAGDAGLLMHFTGDSWETVDTEMSGPIRMVSGTARDDVWVAGYDGVGRLQSEAWTTTPREPNTGIAALAPGPDGVWVVRSRSSSNNDFEYQALLRSDSDSWQEISRTTNVQSQLNDIWVSSDGVVWGVGNNLVLRFR